MADFFKILKADPLGDPWTPQQPGAKPIQNWWCQVEGQDKAVSIGKQVGNSLHPGMHVYGDLKYAKSQKGTEYWKFSSVQIPEGVQRPADTPAQATAQQATGAEGYADQWAQKNTPVVGEGVPPWAIPLCNQVQFIYNEMKKMAGEEPIPEPPKQVEHVGGAPIDEETKATLDAVFGDEEPTPDVVPEDK